jgi:hypothetical protein
MSKIHNTKRKFFASSMVWDLDRREVVQIETPDMSELVHQNMMDTEVVGDDGVENMADMEVETLEERDDVPDGPVVGDGETTHAALGAT